MMRHVCKNIVRLVAALAIGVLVIAVGMPTASATIADKRNDYNGDGISDLLAVGLPLPDTPACLFRWTGDGRGGFGPRSTDNCFVTGVFNAAAPGDLNGDSRGDFVGIRSVAGEECLYRWLSVPGGSLPGEGVRIGCGWEDLVSLTGAGDLNNDGRGDLLAVWRDRDDDLCLYRWNGLADATFGPKTFVGCGWIEYGIPTGVGDITGDGNADLVAVGGEFPRFGDCLYRWNGNGAGGFGPAAEIGCDWWPYDDVAGMGDTTGDGTGDLVARSGDCLYRWNGNRAGGFGPSTLVGCGWDEYQRWDLVG